MSKEAIIIKKYSNRKLYCSKSSEYRDLKYLIRLAKEGKEFKVVDWQTKKDITAASVFRGLFELDSDLVTDAFLKNILKVCKSGGIINFINEKAGE